MRRLELAEEVQVESEEPLELQMAELPGLAIRGLMETAPMEAAEVLDEATLEVLANLEHVEAVMVMQAQQRHPVPLAERTLAEVAEPTDTTVA